jgi:DNA repair exonuclease SbcCD ATPase subunit
MATANESLEQLVAHLDELEGRATPGEWTTFGQAGITSTAGDNMCIAQCWAYAGDQSGDGHDNRAFIIALRNAYGMLRAASQRALDVEATERDLRKAQDEVEQLTRELAKRSQELEAIRDQLTAAFTTAERLGQMLRQALAPTPDMPSEAIMSRPSAQTPAKPPGELPHRVQRFSNEPRADDGAVL